MNSLQPKCHVHISDTSMYEGRSESSNNCLIIHIIFIVKQKEKYIF